MATSTKTATPKGKGATALDAVKTQRKAKAGETRKTADADGGAKPSGDSPKRQGDKLEQATRAASGAKTK